MLAALFIWMLLLSVSVLWLLLLSVSFSSSATKPMKELSGVCAACTHTHTHKHTHTHIHTHTHTHTISRTRTCTDINAPLNVSYIYLWPHLNVYSLPSSTLSPSMLIDIHFKTAQSHV